MSDSIKNTICLWMMGIFCYILFFGFSYIAKKYKIDEFLTIPTKCGVKWFVDRGWRPDWECDSKEEARELAGGGRIYPDYVCRPRRN